MVVLPGAPNSVAISLHDYAYSPSYQGVAIQDNGVIRPRAGLSGSTPASRLIAGSPGYVFGYDNESSEFRLTSASMEDGAFRILENRSDLVFGYATTIVYDADGFLYSSGGSIVDAEIRGICCPQAAFLQVEQY